MKQLLYIFAFFCLVNTLSAQQISLNFESFPGVAYSGGSGYFYGGGGLELAYQQDLGKGRLRGGLEYRIIDWGNQGSLNAGYNFRYYTNGAWRISGTSGVQLGFAFFRSAVPFVWGLEYVPELEWQSSKRFFANIGIGIRYTNNTQYRSYSSINALLELPVRIGWGLRLGEM